MIFFKFPLFHVQSLVNSLELLIVFNIFSVAALQFFDSFLFVQEFSSQLPKLLRFLLS